MSIRSQGQRDLELLRKRQNRLGWIDFLHRLSQSGSVDLDAHMVIRDHLHRLSQDIGEILLWPMPELLDKVAMPDNVKESASRRLPDGLKVGLICRIDIPLLVMVHKHGIIESPFTDKVNRPNNKIGRA